MTTIANKEMNVKMANFSPDKFIRLLIKKSIEGTEREGAKFTLTKMPEEAQPTGGGESVA